MCDIDTNLMVILDDVAVLARRIVLINWPWRGGVPTFKLQDALQIGAVVSGPQDAAKWKLQGGRHKGKEDSGVKGKGNEAWRLGSKMGHGEDTNSRVSSWRTGGFWGWVLRKVLYRFARTPCTMSNGRRIYDTGAWAAQYRPKNGDIKHFLLA